MSASDARWTSIAASLVLSWLQREHLALQLAGTYVGDLRNVAHHDGQRPTPAPSRGRSARRRTSDRVVADGVAAIRRRKGYRYGDGVADLRAEVSRYAAANGYPLGVDYAPVCACGSKTGHHLTVDDAEGGAMLTCCGCAARGFVADSQRYLSPGAMHRDLFRECICRGRAFEVVIGAALYEGSREVRWWYVGGRCLRCGCLGIYGDWKDDGAPWEEALRLPG